VLVLFRRPAIYVVLLSFLGGYLMDSYSVPFEIRFKLSQQALENFARHPVLDYDNSRVQWVGLFPLREVNVVGTTVGMIIGECNFFDDCGFVYSPDGSPQKSWRDNYLEIPFAEHWYYWRRSRGS
jgi:hypothetical protein